jgi:hypothetical protein
MAVGSFGFLGVLTIQQQAGADDHEEDAYEKLSFRDQAQQEAENGAQEAYDDQGPGHVFEYFTQDFHDPEFL